MHMLSNAAASVGNRAARRAPRGTMRTEAAFVCRRGDEARRTQSATMREQLKSKGRDETEAIREEQKRLCKG